jgi:tetratricopeptide (TPR) repeat protein
MLYSLDSDHLKSCGKSVYTNVRPIKLYHVFSGRNAWHSTWIHRYTEGCMHFDLRSARQFAEKKRKQGSKFYIRELPALYFKSEYVSMVITEINTLDTFEDHLFEEININTTLEAVFYHFTPITKNSVIRLIAFHGKDMEVEELYDSKPLHRWISESVGRGYLLQWSRLENKNKKTHVLRLSKTFLAIPFLVQGDELATMGKAAQALRKYRRALKCSPRQSGIHLKIGSEHHERHQYKRAITEFELAKKHSPKSIIPLLRLAEVYKEKGDLKEAINLFRRALKLNTNVSDRHRIALDLAYAIYDRAIELKELRDTAAAKREIHKAMRVNPDSKYLRSQLDELIEELRD